jgi:biotin carboxyl carrier protein
MFRPRNIMIMAVVLTLAAMTWAAASGTLVDQKSTLSGRVLGQGLVSVGANVREGDSLVVVDAITGPATAARANVDGKVKEVRVKAGDNVRTGDVLVIIESGRK